jgi:hypothetical protein
MFFVIVKLFRLGGQSYTISRSKDSMTKKLMVAVLVLGFSALYAGDNNSTTDNNRTAEQNRTAEKNGTDLETMQKMFQRKMKRKCRMSSARFAQEHTVEEWREINASGKMEEEIFRICPRFPKDILTPEQFEAIKGYIIEYGRGSKLKRPNG